MDEEFESIKESPSIRPPERRINLKLIALTLALSLVFVFIIIAAFWANQRKRARKEIIREAPRKQPVQEKAVPFLSFEKLKSDLLLYKTDYPLVVNSEPITWEELEGAIRYDVEVWRIKGSNSSEEKKILIDRLVERKLIEQLARQKGISEPTDEEIEGAKSEMFGSGFDLSRLSSYPEFHAQVKTKALRNKLEQSLVKTYTGALIYAKYKSVGADTMRSKGLDPQTKAKEKVKEYYILLGEKSLDEIIEMVNADEEMAILNDRTKIKKFVEIDIEEAPNPDIKDELKKLVPGRTSEIFIISGPLRPGSTIEEDYGYGFITLEGGKLGEEEDFEQFLEREKKKAQIEIFI